ncbi:MAG: PhzF family phenazine biosynthesis protein [Muribaculaceae bacterium]|nr:PhzF family phenazine biosynthesis protein [Muribaculaceae bacterium]
MKFFIVDAFSSRPFGGNTAGVVLLDKDFPTDELMQQVAAELRYSETAFVRHDGPSTFTVRYFTPAGEVDLCGHATIATFGVLLSLGLVSEGEQCLNHTLAGDLQVTAGKQVMMQMAPATLLPTAVDAERLHRVMGADETMQCPTLPIEIISTGLPDIIMPVASLDALHALRPDMDALAELSRELGVTGVHAFALSDDGFTAHARNFGPLYGVPEESATGTASGALTHYLFRQGLVSCPGECRFMQGEAMGHPSVIETRLTPNGGIQVGGPCSIVAQGELMI